MDEYIKRAYAVDAVLDVYYDTPDIDLSGEKFEAAIFKIPPADVAPVRHGRWERYSDDKFVGYDENSRLKYRKVYKHECSVCLRETAVKSNYCPNCGAKMDLEG